MIKHTLFPTLIVEDSYKEHDEFKQTFYNNIMKHVSVDGYSEERTGNVTLHHDKELSSLYSFVTDKAKEFVRTLKVDDNKFQFNITKSWTNMTHVVDNAVHCHSDSHISFTYYVNIPENGSKALRFYSDHPHPNELYLGFLTHNVDEWNLTNSLAWQFSPEQGDLFIFPSRLKHSVNYEFTRGYSEPPIKSIEDVKMKRICIAGDILLTHKELTTNPLGIQPIENWRHF
jgi:uncharacterized protein (TIGR02466 family)